MANNKKKLVPASKDALYQMKYEIAAELGLPVSHQRVGTGFSDTEFGSDFGEYASTAYSSKGHDSWGHMTSRQTGSVGGEITKRLIAQAGQSFHRDTEL